MYDYLETPAVAIELDTVERNIRTLVDHAAKYGISHRPHTKTHRAWSWQSSSFLWALRASPAQSWAKPRSWQTPASTTSSSATP